jgi:hypothetical protein
MRQQNDLFAKDLRELRRLAKTMGLHVAESKERSKLIDGIIRSQAATKAGGVYTSSARIAFASPGTREELIVENRAKEALSVRLEIVDETNSFALAGKKSEFKLKRGEQRPIVTRFQPHAREGAAAISQSRIYRGSASGNFQLPPSQPRPLAAVA